MWKMFGWFGRAIAVGLIASFLSVWTTGYIVNSYVETLLKQYKLPLEVQPFALSGVWGQLWGADSVDSGTGVADASGDKKDASDSGTVGIGESAGNGGENGANGSSDVNGSASGSAAGDDGNGAAGGVTGDDGNGAVGGVTGSDGNSTKSGTTGGEESGAQGGSSANGVGSDGEDSTSSGGKASDKTADAGKDTASGTNGTGGGAADGTTDAADGSDPVAIDAFGQEEEGAVTGVGGGTGPKVEAGGTTVTEEELTEAKKQLSEADKDQLFEMLATKLPQEAWQTISAYTENGLTTEELTNIQQIVAQYLTEEQYKAFMSILKKY